MTSGAVCPCPSCPPPPQQQCVPWHKQLRGTVDAEEIPSNGLTEISGLKPGLLKRTRTCEELEGETFFIFFLDELELQSVFHIFVFVMTLRNQTRRKMLWCNHNCNPENWIMEQARLLLSWDPNEDRKWIDDFRLLTVCWWYYRGEAAVWQIHLVNITINIIIIIKNHMT